MGETSAVGARLPRAYGWPRLRLLRPLNAFMAGAGSLVGALLATSGAGSDGAARWTLWLVSAVAAMAIAGFGNVLNDLRDEALDRQAHPHRPLPAGAVRRADAWLLALLCLFIGLFAASLFDWRPLAMALVNAFILIAYEMGLKVRGLPGNLAISALVGSTLLFGATAATGQFSDSPIVWLAAGTAALSNLARELLKDVEDADADAAFRWTFPMQHGAGPTLFTALGAGALAVTLAAATLGWGAAFDGARAPAGALVVLASATVLAGGCLAWRDVGAAQRTLKAGMAGALAGFAWLALA